MKDNREEIVKAVESHKKNTCTTSDILNDLGLDSSSGFIALEKELKAMEEDMELVHGANGTWLSRNQAGIYEGKISVNKKGLGFIDRENGESVRIFPEDQNSAMNGDMVLYRCVKWQTFGEVVRVLKRAHTKVVGTVVGNYRPQFVLDDEKLRDKRTRLSVPDGFPLIEGLKLQCTITGYGKNTLDLTVDRIIGHKDDPGVDILSILLEHEIEPEFPEEVMEETMRIPQSVSEQEKEGRRDLTNEITVTIDGDDSKDFDDAVSVVKNDKGWLLKVSIADVSHYVTEGSALDKEALKRGCSTYVTDRVVPMLPHQLSNGICSLNPHVVRLTNTCEMQVDESGAVTDYHVYPSFICSTERMTYHNVNLILDGDEALCEQYSHLGTLFTDLADCADAIRRHRVAKGAIDFDSNEAKIVVDEMGNPTSIELRERGHAERMIEDCMIAANCCVANQMKWANLPCVYRIHEEPQAKRIKNFVNASTLLGHRLVLGKSGVHPLELQHYLNSVKNTPEYPVLSMMLLRCMQKAKYDPNCVGHFGLAEEEYLHFTSPIRRYPDLIVHRMLRKYVYEGCTDQHQLVKDEGLMHEYSEQSSVRERASQDAEFACDDMKKAQYMEDHIGEVFEGIITSVTSFGFYVELPNTIEGLVHITTLGDDYYEYDEDHMLLYGMGTDKVYRIGQKVKVVVLAASRESKNIDFGVFKGKKMKKPSTRNRRTEKGPSSFKGKPKVNRREKHSFRHDKKKTGGGYARNKKQGERSRRKPKGKA